MNRDEPIYIEYGINGAHGGNHYHLATCDRCEGQWYVRHDIYHDDWICPECIMDGKT
jgi:PHP family Zn ribbon phosphoesterase